MPTLYIFVGYPGSGKTTVANYICDATGATHIWSDRERQIMFGTSTHSPQESSELYAYLNLKTSQLLAQGASVVFDTNFNFKKDREHLRSIAEANNADIKLIWLTTAKATAQQRAVHRSHDQPTRVYGNMDEATFSRIAGHLQPPRASEQPIKIDGVKLTKQAALEAVGLA